MADEAVTYRTLRTGVRPARAAVWVERTDAGWEHTALRVLECLSVTWGGFGHIIVPGDRRGNAHPLVAPVAHLLDPDHWLAYHRTLRDEELGSPSSFEERLEQTVEQFVEDHGGDGDAWRDDIREQLRDVTLGAWPPPEAFFAHAREWRAPIWDAGYGRPKRLVADGGAGVSMVDVARLSPLPELVLVPETSKLPLPIQVMAAMRWGALAPHSRTALAERGVGVVDIPIEASEVDTVIDLCWRGSSLGSDLALPRPTVPPSIDPPTFASQQLGGDAPMALSMIGCAVMARTLLRPEDRPFTIVAGSTMDDFALALALDRCLGDAIWLPGCLLDSPDRPATIRALGRAIFSRHSSQFGAEAPIRLCSCSTTSSGLEMLRAEIAESGYPGTDRVSVDERASVPPLRPLSVLDCQRYERPIDEPFLGNTTARGLDTPTPSSVAGLDADDLMWFTDVRLFGHQLPPRWPLNSKLVVRSSAWRSIARVSAEGIAYNSHPSGFVATGTPLELIIDRPQLRFMSAEEVFRELADYASAEIQRSAAGKYTSQALEQWPSREALVSDLKLPLARRLFDLWLSKAPSGRDPGNLIRERRYLTRGDATGACGEDVHELLDRYLTSHTIRRGLCLACSRCDNFDWYDADDVGQSFACTRCRAVAVIDATTTRGPAQEPEWYYQLSEVFYQAYRHNLSVPLLAIDLLGATAESSLSMTDHCVTVEGEQVEVDIWLIRDGEVIIGEAKIGDNLGDRKKRNKKAKALRRVADLMTADRVVFATAMPAWQGSALQAVESAFAGSRSELQFLTSVDPTAATND